jgi:hypothetical protein
MMQSEPELEGDPSVDLHAEMVMCCHPPVMLLSRRFTAGWGVLAHGSCSPNPTPLFVRIRMAQRGSTTWLLAGVIIHPVTLVQPHL